MSLLPESQKIRYFPLFFRSVLVYKKTQTHRALESQDCHYTDMSYNPVTESVSCSKSTSKIIKIQGPPELSEDYTDMDCSATTEYVSTHLQATSQKQDASYLHPHQISTELSTSTESEEFHEKANPTYEESDYIYEC